MAAGYSHPAVGDPSSPMAAHRDACHHASPVHFLEHMTDFSVFCSVVNCNQIVFGNFSLMKGQPVCKDSQEEENNKDHRGKGKGGAALPHFHCVGSGFLKEFLEDGTGRQVYFVTNMFEIHAFL